MLELEGVSAGYGRFPVLRDVSLTVKRGEIVALIGANGAGKSTLLNTVMGLLGRVRGVVRFDGHPITRHQTPDIVRAGIAQVPERRQLFGAMTVEENLLMGAYTAKDRAGTARLLDEQYARFPVLRERRRQLAQTLSGGQQQMVAIARAMMSRPRMLLLDEPSLGLAPLVVSQILGEIAALRDAGGTVLVVEQNAHAALGVADRGYVLENGRVAASGPAHELLHSPAVQDAYLGGQGSSQGGQRGVEDRIRSRKKELLGR